MTQSLRIALLLNPFTLHLKGGDHAPALARELLGRGHTVRGFGATPGAIPRSGSDPLVDGGVLPEDAVGPLGFRPDVVVAYDGLSPAAWLGARTARKLEVPLIVVESGFAQNLSWYERIFRRSAESLWGRYVRNTARRVVALDPVAREQSLREGFPSERIELLPSGVDLNEFRPGLASRLTVQNKVRGRILLHVGRLEEGRGLETLISAFAGTVGQRDDWSLVFAGDGNARGRLRALVVRLGIGARVHWLAKPRVEELPGLMGASTLMAVPALDDSVKGKQIPRALACGLPVLASDLPRLAFQVEHDGCGLIGPPGELQAWTEMLRKACGEPMSRKRWRHRARELAEERFAWAEIGARFEATCLGVRDEALAGGDETADATLPA